MQAIFIGGFVAGLIVGIIGKPSKGSYKSPALEWLGVDSSYIKLHRHGVLVRCFITSGTVSDSRQAQNLISDRAYDSDA